MNKKEFIASCKERGYASEKEAEEYCGDRETFTDDDLINAYRKYNRIPSDKFHMIYSHESGFVRSTYRSYGKKSDYWDDEGAYK